MLSYKEQAIEFIRAIPDDKCIYIMDMFRGIRGFLENDMRNDKQQQQILSEESLQKRKHDAKQILLDLIATAEPDPTFIRPTEIPWETTTPREAFN